MKFYLFVAFITGMAVTVVELAAARLLAPYFGASLFVWTNVIGVILIGLAFGYVAGGRIADRQTDTHILFRCIGVAGVLVFASPFLIRLLVPFVVVDAVFTRTIPLVLIAGSFVAALLLFFFPVFLLGMTSPFLISVLGRRVPEKLGTMSGRIFAWSTLGSILGVFGTGILFVPFFGTRETLFGTAIALLLLAAIGERRRARTTFSFGLVLVIVVGSLWQRGPLRASENLLYEVESPYQYIRVIEDEGSRYLIFNEGNGPQSVWHPDTIETNFYYDYLAPLLTFFPKEQSLRILLVGLGGGTIPSQYRVLYPDRSYTIDVAEIDPKVVDVARDFFALPYDRLQLFVADGRTFLASTDAQYDIIILDAFAQQYYIPWHLTTREFFATVRERLAPNGIVVFNVDAARRESSLLQSIVRTVQEVFPHVVTVPMPNSWNQIVFAKDAPIVFGGASNNPFLQKGIAYLQENVHAEQKTDGMILTDNRAPVEMMTDLMFTQEALRR